MSELLPSVVEHILEPMIKHLGHHVFGHVLEVWMAYVLSNRPGQIGASIVAVLAVIMLWKSGALQSVQQDVQQQLRTEVQQIKPPFIWETVVAVLAATLTLVLRLQ
jgi:hypothetical protein